MAESDIRQKLIRCLQSPPYPPDGGPLCLRPDGTYIQYSGWGNGTGRYRVSGNTIILISVATPGVPPDESAISIYESPNGSVYARFYPRDNPVLLSPILETEELGY